MGGGARVGPVSELQGDLGVRSEARRRSAASSAARRARAVHSDAIADSARRACCRSRSSESQAREQMRAWYRSRWFAPNKLKTRGAHRHGPRPLPSVLDVRRAGRGAVDRGSGPLLLRDGPPRRQDASRSASPLGAGRRRARSFLRRRAGAGDQRRGREAAEQGRAVSRPIRWCRTTRATCRAGWSSGIRSIWSPPRSTRARVMEGKVRAMCAQQVPGDTQRNLQVDADYSAQTFKHILVPVWLLTYNYGTQTYQVVINGVTGADRRPVSVELDQDRAGRPRRADRLDDLRLAR